MQGQSLSSRIWKINWDKELPKTLSSGIKVTYSRYQGCKNELNRIMGLSYRKDQSNSPFADKGSANFKESYYQEVGDFFLFTPADGQAPIGAAVCVLKDHASIDFRSITLVEEYQNKGIYPEFMELLAAILDRHGVSRIEGDVSPTNNKHHQALAKMGFCFTGVNTSTSHGVLNHVVRYLSSVEKERFADLFSETASSDNHANNAFQKKAG